MKLIPASAHLITEKDPYKKIELAGRTCYKSESKITDDSAPKFCRGLIKSRHTAMVEHQVFCFELSSTTGNMNSVNGYIGALRAEPYFHVTVTPFNDLENNRCYTRVLVSANVRAISERGVNDPVWRAVRDAYPDLAYTVEGYDPMETYPSVVAEIADVDEIPNLTEEEALKHKNLTFRFITDRGVTHELVRHRPCSFAQESTRYANYSKEQFGSELTFIMPSTFNEWALDKRGIFAAACAHAEDAYMAMTTVADVLTAQQARAILPNCIKTEIVVTANLTEWQHILNLRLFGTTGAPHPDIKALMELAWEEIQEKDALAAKFLKDPAKHGEIELADSGAVGKVNVSASEAGTQDPYTPGEVALCR